MLPKISPLESANLHRDVADHLFAFDRSKGTGQAKLHRDFHGRSRLQRPWLFWFEEHQDAQHRSDGQRRTKVHKLLCAVFGVFAVTGCTVNRLLSKASRDAQARSVSAIGLRAQSE